MLENIIIILAIISILLLSGCINSANRDTGILEKTGKVVKINYDVIFGGTFIDWRDDVYFDDGTMMMVKGGDLSIIEFNKIRFFQYYLIKID